MHDLCDRKVVSVVKQVTFITMSQPLISPRSPSYVLMGVWCSAVIAVSFCTHHPLSPMGTQTPRFVFTVIIHMQTALRLSVADFI